MRVLDTWKSFLNTANFASLKWFIASWTLLLFKLKPIWLMTDIYSSFGLLYFSWIWEILWGKSPFYRSSAEIIYTQISCFKKYIEHSSFDTLFFFLRFILPSVLGNLLFFWQRCALCYECLQRWLSVIRCYYFNHMWVNIFFILLYYYASSNAKSWHIY